MAKTDTQISLRVTSQFKARLERQAERERRTVSNLILKVMEEYLEQQEGTAGGASPSPTGWKDKRPLAEDGRITAGQDGGRV